MLFTHSYFYRLDPKQWANKKPYPPLGTIQAAALARDAGFEVDLFDTNLRESPQEIKEELERDPPRFLVIYDDGFNYLTKMCLTVMREAAFTLIKMAKAKGSTVIISSSDATDHYEKYLKKGADFVLLGEGEVTLKELLCGLELGMEDFQNIEGLVYQSEGEMVRTRPRTVLRDLDSLPMAAWDLVDIEDYRKIWKEHHGYFSLNIATTRGCPFKCNWCAKPIYGNRYNSRSPQRVVAEIAYLLTYFEPEHFWMCDDIFGLKPGWVEEFSQLVDQRQLRFSYMIQSRVDLLVKDHTVKALAKSGAETIWVGAESGSQKVLDAMDKGTTVEQIYQATGLMKKYGVRTGFFLQFGYPGEVKEDIDKTINMVLDLLPDEIGISVSYPLPGTKFYENVKNDLANKANWRDSNDLDMLFSGTYRPEYYRRLHRYVHKLFRRYKGLESIREGLSYPFSPRKIKLRTALSTFYYWPTSLVERYKLNKLESTR